MAFALRSTLRQSLVEHSGSLTAATSVLWPDVDERAAKLRVESSPSTPRADDHARVELFERRDGDALARRRSARDGGAEEEGVEKHARHAARRMWEVELECAAAADDATSMNVRRVAEVDVEMLDDGKGIVGEELAAQFVARESVAIEERDVDAALCE